jgi:hypothetical protein
VKFGLAGKDLGQRLDPLRDRPGKPVCLGPEVKLLGRDRAGAIRDGALLTVS